MPTSSNGKARSSSERRSVRGFCVPSHEHPNGASYANSKKNRRRSQEGLIRTKGTRCAQRQSRRKLRKEQEPPKPSRSVEKTVDGRAQTRDAPRPSEETCFEKRLFTWQRTAFIRAEVCGTGQFRRRAGEARCHGSSSPSGWSRGARGRKRDRVRSRSLLDDSTGRFAFAGRQAPGVAVYPRRGFA